MTNNRKPRHLVKANDPAKPVLQMPVRPGVFKQASEFTRQCHAPALDSPTGNEVLGQLFCPTYRSKTDSN